MGLSSVLLSAATAGLHNSTSITVHQFQLVCNYTFKHHAAAPQLAKELWEPVEPLILAADGYMPHLRCHLKAVSPSSSQH